MSNETEPLFEDVLQASHIYPTWVSEGTCSTKCVDIRGEEEFCVATSVCEHSTWRKAFDKLKFNEGEQSLGGFEPPMSLSSCEVWGDTNRCDGTLCDDDHECQSGCCGAFVSFTHHRCLPILGDYCPGRDTTRKVNRKNENSIDMGLDRELALAHELLGHTLDENEEEQYPHEHEALAHHALDLMHDGEHSELTDMVSELL